MAEIMAMEISATTRRLLIDELRASPFEYSGALTEIEFLERIYDLDALPSTDGRPQYTNLRDDVMQHRVQWPEDYGPDWLWTDKRLDLLGGSDENLLRFLSEMVHPLVRRDHKDVDALLTLFNKHLRFDGYEIVQAGLTQRRPFYRGRKLDGGVASVLDESAEIPDLGEHVRAQIDRMRGSMQTDPTLAIGTAKELIESVSKTVLRQRGVPFDPAEEVQRLARMAVDAVPVVPSAWTGDPNTSAAVRSLLGALTNIGSRLAELRNKAGTGHGREAAAVALQPMHARLACDAAATFAVFVLSASRPPTSPT